MPDGLQLGPACSTTCCGRRWRTWGEPARPWISSAALELPRNWASRWTGRRVGCRISAWAPAPGGPVPAEHALLRGVLLRRAAGRSTVVNFNPLYVERELEKSNFGTHGTTVMAVMDLEAVYRPVGTIAAAAGLTRLIVCPMASILPPSTNTALFRGFKRKDVAAIPADALHMPFPRHRPRPARRRTPPVAVKPAISRCCNIPAAPPARPRAPC